ncbi:hypothetical protein K7432_015729 [Basidiobolus ranarum]|uniref:Uncharacterized protein n=1 Tax=Basidiobolus ranarum TaxID=34480 RepID=A0ABR2WFT8_9FUNG
MFRYIGILLSILVLAIHVIDVTAVQILDIAECRTCFAALAPGCKEKMSSADSSSSAGTLAMKECMCTKQYFSTFTACGTCSAKSMNSNAVPDQTALDGLRQSCTAVGLNVEQGTSSTTNSGSSTSSSNSGNSGQSQNNMSNSNTGRNAGNTKYANSQGLFMIMSLALFAYLY